MGKKKAWIAAAALILGAIVWYAISSNRVSLLEARVSKLEQAESANAILRERIKKRDDMIADLGASCVSMATHIERSERIIVEELSDMGKGPPEGIGGE